MVGWLTRDEMAWNTVIFTSRVGYDRRWGSGDDRFEFGLARRHERAVATLFYGRERKRSPASESRPASRYPNLESRELISEEGAGYVNIGFVSWLEGSRDRCLCCFPNLAGFGTDIGNWAKVWRKSAFGQELRELPQAAGHSEIPCSP